MQFPNVILDKNFNRKDNFHNLLNHWCNPYSLNDIINGKYGSFKELHFVYICSQL